MEASRREWRALHSTLSSLGATIELVPPAPGLPDLVFTANAAVVFDRMALLARFRYPERQGEGGHYEAAVHALQARGVIDAVRHLPQGVSPRELRPASALPLPRTTPSGLPPMPFASVTR